jgi:hypothetical protein
MASAVWTDPGTLVTIQQAREQIQLDQSKQTVCPPRIFVRLCLSLVGNRTSNGAR